MDRVGVPWCVVGDMLLAYYRVPKATAEIQVLVPPTDLDNVRDAFSELTDFRRPFPRTGSNDHRHLAQFPRFKVKGMRQWLYLVPGSHYGLRSKAFADIVRLPGQDVPFPRLPHYVQGLATQPNAADLDFLRQIECLVDGMDIDEEWCERCLDGSARAHVRGISTRKAKRDRMGSHPQYAGNLTAYIHDEAGRQRGLWVSPEGDWTALVDRFVPIHVMSDLHLELSFGCPEGESRPGYEVFDCTPASPTLALLGDVGAAVHGGLYDYLRKQLRKYEKVLFLLGNHEHYGSCYEFAISRTLEFAQEMQKQRAIDHSLGELVFLHRTRYDLSDDVTILGCTLWSHIPPSASETVERRVNDFKRIPDWSVARHNAIHSAEAQWLDDTCAEIRATEPRRRIAISTHHAPLVRGTSDPKHQGGEASAAFATDMSGRGCWGPPVSLWAFGHTHYNCDFVRDDVRVVSNQRGYEGIESSRTHFIKDMILLV